MAMFRDRDGGSRGAERPRSGAGGALDASSREWMMWRPRGGQLVWRGCGRLGWGAWVCSLLVVGCAVVALGMGEEGSQTYLGARACGWPGDMMIDWVSPRAAGGCGRSVFGGRPLGLPCAAGAGAG